MGFHLEKFNRTHSRLRGAQLHNLVKNQRDWVDSALPKVGERYGDTKLKAQRNFFRLAGQKAIHPLLILDDWDSVIGTASATPRQRLIAQDGSFRRHGTDVDYWARKSLMADEHNAIGRLLLNFVHDNAASPITHNIDGAGDGASIEATQTRSHKVMTTVIPGAENQPHGLITFLEPVGAPGILATSGPAELELTKDAQTLQLHYGEFPYHPNHK
jgi:hypothetical protein